MIYCLEVRAEAEETLSYISTHDFSQIDCKSAAKMPGNYTGCIEILTVFFLLKLCTNLTCMRAVVWFIQLAVDFIAEV